MSLEKLFAGNLRWAKQRVEEDPQFFQRLCGIQSPRFLWIGCSDSRVPANEIVDLAAGELFVHRNVGNVVSHADMNCLAVVQYAVQALGVEHIIVTGHYGCGGVMAAMRKYDHGTLESWLGHIRDVYRNHYEELQELSPEQRGDRLVELNVIQQVANVARLPVVQGAWEQGQPLQVHGLVYRLSDGILRDLQVTAKGIEDLHPAHRVHKA